MMTLIKLLRLPHWFKNVLIFAPLFFTLQFTTVNIIIVSVGFFAFSLLASSVYIMNDLFDINEDRTHPKKQLRPIAMGAVPPAQAILLAVVCAMVSIIIAGVLDLYFLIIMLIYGLLNISYTVILKKIIFIDVLVVAIGFVLRIFAGSALLQVSTSHWIILCTFFGALFISFIKRKQEMICAEQCSENHRSVLQHYTSNLLQQSIIITATLTIVSYALYTIDRETIQRFQTDLLFITLVFVVFGILRFIYLIDRKPLNGVLNDDPTDLFLRDKPLLINLSAWLISFFTIIAL